MLKKTILILGILAVLFAIPAFAAVNFNSPNINTTLRFPLVDMYNTNNNGLILNISVNRTSSMNITNVSFIFTKGTNITYFTNSTINGSTPLSNSESHFSYNISRLGLTEGTWNVTVEVRNATEVSNRATAINTSSVIFVIDRSSASVTIQKPNQGQTVASKGVGKVEIEYTPTDPNLGNSTYYINGVRQTSSTSGTTSPNITSGVRNKFTQLFGANNNSVTLIVEITDLAGNKANSSTTTFSVFRDGSPEVQSVFITPSGEVISTPAQPKGKAITKPLAIGELGNLLVNPFVWGTLIVAAVGFFIWWQNRKR